VGPTGEGLILTPSVEILTQVGEWVQRNGESIYGTTASPFSALPWGRCTVKGEKLYLHVFDWPPNGRLEIPGLKNQPRAAHLLADQGHRLPVTRQGDRVMVDLPAGPIDDADTVVVLEIVGQPQVDPPVVSQDTDGTVLLDYVHAITAGKAVKRFNRKGRFHISKWTDPQDTIAWHLDVAKPWIFKVHITYAARDEQQGRAYVVSVGGQQLSAQVQDTGDWYDYQTFSIGTVELPEAGRYTLTIRPANSSEADLMYFKTLQLS
jgi:alpha-L-fucosidase